MNIQVMVLDKTPNPSFEPTAAASQRLQRTSAAQTSCIPRMLLIRGAVKYFGRKYGSFDK